MKLVSPPSGGTLQGVERARLGRGLYIAHVGVPDRLAAAEAADRLPVLNDIGDDVEFGQALDETAAALLHRGPVKVAEQAAEGNQIRVA